MKALTSLWVLIPLALLALQAALALGPFVWNGSPSLPTGYWYVEPFPEGHLPSASEISGSFVRWCPAGPHPSPNLAGSCPDGRAPLAKLACAAPNLSLSSTRDAVILASDGEVVHRHPWSRPLDAPKPPEKSTLAASEVFLLGVHDRSWDSRLFGGVPAGEINARLRPFLTTGLGAETRDLQKVCASL